MPTKTINGDAGLWIESSTVNAPPNALRLANNVLLHRPGIIRPRFGWRNYATLVTAYRPYVLYPFDTETIAISYNGSAYRYEQVVEGVTYSDATFTAVPPGIADSLETKFARGRGTLYSTSTKGVIRQEAVGEPLERAGAYTFFVFPYAGAVTEAVDPANTRVAIATNKSVAYQYVWVHTDGNGYTRRSPPSNRWIVDNTAANGVRVLFDRLYLPHGITSPGDQIEFYRSLGVSNGGLGGSVTPGTELYLCITHTVTSAEVSAGYVDRGPLLDDVPDDQLGAALYTNPSQGGALQAKYPPPLARDIAMWQGVMWYGHCTERASIQLEFVRSRLSADTTAAGRSFSPVGWAFQANPLRADFTLGSAIVAITPAAITVNCVGNMKTGQYVMQNDHTPEIATTNVPASTTVTAIRTLITIDNAALAANDTIQVGDITFTWKVAAGSSTEVTIGGTSAASATNLAAKISAYSWTSTTDANTDFSLTASANSTVVTITDASGYGVHPVITQVGVGMNPTYSVTMSANALATNAGASMTTTDWISINSTKFYAAGTSFVTVGNDASLFLPTWRGLNTQFSGSSETNQLTALAALAALGIGGYTSKEAPVSFGIAAQSDGPFLTLTAITPDVGNITVQCSVRPNAFRPNLADALTSETRTHSGRIAWSLPQEPEAVRLLDFTDVGDPSKAVDRIIPLRDALLVWKRDGLYRVTGAPPDQWRVDPIDTTIRLVHPECVNVLENVCYAWTNRGVMSVTEAGLGDIVSLPIQPALRDMQILLEADTTQTHRGFWMSVHPRLRLVTLAVNEGEVTGQPDSDAQYVLHLSTGVWAKNTRSQLTSVWSPELGRMLESSGLGEWRVLQESREVEDDSQVALEGYSDWKQSSITLNETAGSYISTVLVSAVTPRVFDVGDAIVFNDGYGRVTEATSNGTTWTLTTTRIGAATGSLSVSWHKAIDSQAQWHAQTIGSPGVGGHWQEAIATLESTQSFLGSWPFDIGGASHIQDRDAVEIVSPSVTAANDANVYSKPIRVGLPRNICRSPTLYPYIRVRNALTNWAISTMSLLARETGARVSR